ncbi:hypothetical protein N2152v2_005269 [Parachlorella kessleri]
MDEFIVPADPGELFKDDSDGALPLKVVNLTDLSEASPEEIGELAEGLSFVLCDNDPLCIVEQDNFDQLCSLLRCFRRVDGSKRRQLVDSLCSSLTCLTAWIDRLLASPADTEQREAVILHRSAFKAYVFFLQWLAEQASRESRAAEAAQPADSSASSAAASGRGGGRGRRKAAPQEVAGWQWAEQFPKVVKSVAQALNADLRALFRPNRPEEGLMQKAIQLATAALESPAAAKDEHLAGNAAHILGVCALKYDQLEVVTSMLAELLAKYDHTPELVAELLRYSVATWDDTRLAAGVIGEVAAVDPSEYERQQKATGEKAGVRSVAGFVEALAQRLPRILAQQISLLLPHLGGEAHSLRCGIVTAIGCLLHKGFESTPGETADAQGAEARLRTKQHLLDVLCERIRDQTSYVRKDVLQTWQMLAAANAIPLGHWQHVTDMAIGRLEDKSSLVRKEALRVLNSLLVNNPFGPRLAVDRYASSLQEHRAMLELLMPADVAGEEGAWAEVQIEQEAAGGQAAAGGSEPPRAPAVVVVKPEPGTEAGAGEEDEREEDQEMAPVEEGGEEEGEEPAGQAEEAAAPVQEARPAARTPAEVGWDGTLEELQALVASLAMAVEFAQALTGAMALLTQLLASSTASDVQESIALLLTCKQFAVDGSAEAIRKMLPLVFSREQAVKTHIVEALDQLYITGWAGNMFSSEQAARNLIELATGATLGELGALEEVVKEFLGKGFLTPVMLHEMWGIADKAYEAVARGAAQADRAHKDLRAALAVLSMAAGTQPQAFNKPHLLSLLRYGFSSRCPDALITKHACTALLRLADNFHTGAYDEILDKVYAALTRTLIASPLPEASWFSAAESAVAAIYVLHRAPEQLSMAVLRHLAGRAFNSRGVQAAVAAAAAEAGVEGEPEVEGADPTMPSLGAAGGSSGGCRQPHAYSASLLSRFFFVLGHVALQHLVYIERMTKAVRRSRHEAEKRAAEERSEQMASGCSQPENEDINAQLGVGSVAADAELDAMKEASEAQILAMTNLLGPYARVVSAVCHRPVLLSCSLQLRSSALLALTKLMVVDASFCEANLQLLFTLLSKRSIEAGLRSNLVIAVGDLALRFPNLLEPWTEVIYQPLTGDNDTSVRKNAMMVLTHLILNDMMKVKGHIAKMAVCLDDEDKRVSALARLFFHELAKKEYKGTSPIYNLLPDILSNLSKESSLSKAQFQSIMEQLLAYIKKDKQGDSLIEKLCQRYAATEDPHQWHNISFCLTQLPMSDKGLKKLCESFKLYRHALHDEEVAAAITGIFAKAKKGSAKADVKALIEDFELRLTDFAAERAEEERTDEAARQHAERCRGGRDGQGEAAAGEGDESASLGGTPADSDLVSDVCNQVAGLDINAEVKPDPDAVGATAADTCMEAAHSAQQEEEEDDDAVSGSEEDQEEQGGEAAEAEQSLPAGLRRGGAAPANSAASAGGTAPRPAAPRRPAAQPAAQPDSESEESESEGSEGEDSSSSESADSGEEGTAPNASRHPTGRGPARRTKAVVPDSDSESDGGESDESDGEPGDENVSTAANLPAVKSRKGAAAPKRGAATSQSRRTAAGRRSGAASVVPAKVKVKVEPQ